jgi:hypothetical protein
MLLLFAAVMLISRRAITMALYALFKRINQDDQRGGVRQQIVQLAPAGARIARIRDTKHLEELWASEPLLPELLDKLHN